MIRAFYGLTENPFSFADITLLEQQQDIFDTLKVHCHQGGLCLLMGLPGTGKTVIKDVLKESGGKRTLVVTVARTLHTYTNTVRLLCQAFNIEYKGDSFKCEKRLITEAYALKRAGQSLLIIIDDAHLMDMITLRKLRLLFEDFPQNHNIILIGQPELLNNISLNVNADIKSRVTYSVITKRLNPQDTRRFILAELDKVALGHNTFTDEALDLIVRSTDGVLRRVKNLCLSCFIEAVRSRKKIIDLDNVNRVLIQPHWRKEQELTELF
jgi:type II secretory pathway predicted ATPase ExeA